MTAYNQTTEAIRRLKGLPYNAPPPPEAAIHQRLKAVTTYHNRQPHADLRRYLQGLGFVRRQVIAARNTLRREGKKKYESALRGSLALLSVEYSDVRQEHFNTLQDLLNIPFRRSATKDDYEARLTLRLVMDHIIHYRHRQRSTQRDYAKTIARNASDDYLPPELAGIIINDVANIIADASATGVYAYTDTGLTCAECKEPDSHEDDSRDFTRSPPIHWPVDGIAQQSLWWGHNDEIDCFLMSLAGGLLHSASPSTCPSE